MFSFGTLHIILYANTSVLLATYILITGLS